MPISGVMCSKLLRIRYHVVLQLLFSFWLLADKLCVSVLCTRATIFDLTPPVSTYVAVDSPDESAGCGQGSMIGRAFAAGRPVAPLPRRGTDAGGAPLDRDEYDGSELAGLPVKSLTIPNTVAPPAFRCYRRPR